MSNFTDFIQRNTSVNGVEDRAADFADPDREFETAQTTASKCALLSLGIVSIAGADAQEFVNGQFTTDCTEITPERSQFSGWCDPKGRVLFLFTLYTDGERIYAILPEPQVANFMRRLQMYVMRADVQLDNVTSARAIFGCTGETGTDGTSTVTLNEPWDTAQLSASTTIIRLGLGRPRFIIIGSDTSAIERWNAINMPIIGENAWTALECIGGVPRIDDKTSGQYLPQNLNLDRLDALSFSKGCYPGQEIIARLKYRGEVKKRLMVARYDSSTAPDPRTPIHTNSDTRTVGHVLFAQRVSPTQTIVSAVVEVGAWDDVLLVDGGNDSTLDFIDLPYSVD